MSLVRVSEGRVWVGVRSRLRRWSHRSRTTARRTVSALPGLARRAPLPVGVRVFVSNVVLWRWRRVEVPISQILQGGQNGVTGDEFARLTKNPMWPSGRVCDGPHRTLLDLGNDRDLTDEEILASSYANLARQSIAVSGHYFGATDHTGVLELARAFLARGSVDIPAPPDHAGLHSLPGATIMLAPIRDSPCYQLVDGHHRVALEAYRGTAGIRARVRRIPVTTPLQRMLDEMSWIGGERELYQPISAPELSGAWTTVRRCSDRLSAMTSLLDDLGLSPRATTYLDVASCYGWFVASMAARGHDVQGIERDPLAPGLGAAVYGLDPSRVHTGDAVDFLRSAGRRWDAVSCFSLLHHFELGRGSVDAVELLRLLDSATRRVLFLDTGQAHEEWFRDSLPAWDTDHVLTWLERHGTFDEVIDLGPDQDAVGPYAFNYGRHLVACVRNR